MSTYIRLLLTEFHCTQTKYFVDLLTKQLLLLFEMTIHRSCLLIFLFVYQFDQNISVARFRFAPTTEDFSVKLVKVGQQLWLLAYPLLVLFNRFFSSSDLEFSKSSIVQMGKRISPLTFDWIRRSTYINIIMFFFAMNYFSFRHFLI